MRDSLRYGQIRKYDIANGPGIRTTVFVTGCRRHCKGCFNPEYQDFNAGKTPDTSFFLKLREYLENPSVSGLTLLGGEPFEPENICLCLKCILQAAHAGKPVWVYSGFTFEEIIKDKDKKTLLECCDVLVDGPFVEVLKDPSLRFRGSSNQRIVDVKKSLKVGKVVLWKDGFYDA